MTRFWVSWWSTNALDTGCTKAPFQTWTSGSRGSRPGQKWDEESLCAVIDAESEEQVVAAVQRHYPDAEMRFCEPRADDFKPGDRFPGFENRTPVI